MFVSLAVSLQTLRTVLAIIGKMSIYCGFGVLFMLTSEVYPTVVRYENNAYKCRTWVQDSPLEHKQSMLLSTCSLPVHTGCIKKVFYVEAYKAYTLITNNKTQSCIQFLNRACDKKPDMSTLGRFILKKGVTVDIIETRIAGRRFQTGIAGLHAFANQKRRFMLN